MADVYVLASPAPALYVYPSALHPSTPVTPPPSSGGGGRLIHRPPQLPKPQRRRDNDETALAVLGAI